jgi:oxygen-independent coproporphyrinogen-3 oxidase
MVGLGMSGISDSWYAFTNEKTVEGYEQMVNNGEFPVVKDIFK